MRVAIFFDGKNFYAGWRASSRPRIDFPALADWLVTRVKGTSLWGAHYYTALEVGDSADGQSQEALRSYLDMLDLQPGYFVHRFPRKPIGTTCHSCGAPQRFTTETGVDTALASDAVRLAAIGAYDVLILVSGDGDHAPIVDAVRALGKQAYVATWGRASLSKYLRLAAFDHIDFLTGVAEFIEGASEAYGEEPPPADEPGYGRPVRMTDIFLQEVRRAEDKFDEGYVGLHYFLTRWKSDRLDASAETRRRILDEAVEFGVVEIYDAADGAKAIRSLRHEDDNDDDDDDRRPETDDDDAYDFGEEV